MVLILWRQKTIILLAALLGLVIGLAKTTLIDTPIYAGTATLVIESREERVLGLQNVVGGLAASDSTVMNSEVEVMRSRFLIGKVIDRLDLTADSEFNPALSRQDETDPGSMRETAISRVIARLGIRNIPNSLVFEITFHSEDPRKAALIADTISDAYVQEQIDVKFAANRKAIEWLTGRLVELEAEMETSERALQSFSASASVINSDAIFAQEVQLKSYRTEIERLSRASGDMSARIDALRVAASELETQIADQGRQLSQFEKLTRDAQANRLLYEHFLTRLKETSAQLGIQQSDSRVLSNAVVPTHASSPRIALVAMILTLLGAACGTVFVAGRHAFRQTFRTSGELEDFSGYPVLGQIPQLPQRDRRAFADHLRAHPASQISESVRNLRTSLQLAGDGLPPQVVVCTSAMPGDGKSTVAVGLALNMAALGRKVLLIEGDIRKRTLAEFFPRISGRRLQDALPGERPLSDFTASDPVSGLQILFGDEKGVNAADLFASKTFARLIERARSEYDHVIIDTPPVLAVPDVRVILPQADFALLVARWGGTSREELLSALRVFESSGQQISGLVLNQVDIRRMRESGLVDAYESYDLTWNKA